MAIVLTYTPLESKAEILHYCILKHFHGTRNDLFLNLWSAVQIYFYDGPIRKKYLNSIPGVHFK